jgi:hypothetical protein
MPLWETTTGHHTLSPAAFHEVIANFNERFLRRMADRVAIAQAEWTRPEVALSPFVADNQLASMRLAQKCLAGSASHEPDDWDLTLAGITRIQMLPRFASGTARRLS